MVFVKTESCPSVSPNVDNLHLRTFAPANSPILTDVRRIDRI